MRIQSIYIKNFKHFREQEFRFNEQFTLIIGDNGTGKTSVLEAVGVGIGGYLAGLDGVHSRNIHYDDIRRERSKLGDATVNINPQLPVQIGCEGHLLDEFFSWMVSKESYYGNTRRSRSRDIVRHAKEMQRQIVQEKRHEIVLPVISYQSAGRLFSQKREKWSDPFKKEETSRFVGYTDCLDAESNIKLFVNWLKKMTTIQLQKRKTIGELDAVLGAIENFITALLDEHRPVSIAYDFEEEEVLVEIGDERLPLRIMSSGYRTVIGMVADIAYRMSILNPQLRDRAVQETPGIVLIDELDLHLHPKWQWRIVQALKQTFPRVQFIATTHAPIIISSCHETEIINLHEGEEAPAKSEKTPYGWLIEDILTDIMDTHPRSPEVEKEIEVIRALYTKKVLQGLSEEEWRVLREKSRHLLNILPEGDPAVTMAKIDAIGRAAEGQADD